MRACVAGRERRRAQRSAAALIGRAVFLAVLLFKALLCGEMSPVNMRLERQISWRGARGFEDLYFLTSNT